MNETLLFGLITFAFVTAITPGPNNLMLMSSVMLFGVRRTLPHMLGIQLGFSLLLAAAVLGLGELIRHFPQAALVVKLVGSIWLCWLGVMFLREAFRQHRGQGDDIVKKTSRPFHFFEAALFQWANPKALIMAFSSAGLYAGIAEDIMVRTIVIVVTFMMVGLPCSITWMMLGRALNHWLGEASHGRVVNIIMALLIFGLVIMILLN
ncbi:Transporter, LysE family [hydrothermal vent metagenome]|uniref:Transporter, LysE family n=1 Tax=hydrothermal vent metagenome TaxID=652676 RepID=A0A3B0TD18_9ZZZZ